MTTTVYMIIFMQRSLADGVAFYKTLGLERIFEIPNQWAEMQGGNIKIGLCVNEQERPVHRTGIVFNNPDLYAFYQAHKDTLLFMSVPIEKTHGIMVSVQDPNGNIVDLYQPTPEKVQEAIVQAKKDDICCKSTSEACLCKDRSIPKA